MSDCAHILEDKTSKSEVEESVIDAVTVDIVHVSLKEAEITILEDIKVKSNIYYYSVTEVM